MFLSDVTSAGPLPALELTVRFAGERQRLLAHNIANISTPDFQPMDVDPASFQRLLGRAIQDRRHRPGELPWRQTSQIRRTDAGDLRLEPAAPSRNILFHDRNNRDVERMMQDLAENAATFRVAVDLIRQHTSMIRNALAERVG
jgi:flagellar basal-body rod protein FlgB